MGWKFILQAANLTNLFAAKIRKMFWNVCLDISANTLTSGNDLEFRSIRVIPARFREIFDEE